MLGSLVGCIYGIASAAAYHLPGRYDAILLLMKQVKVKFRQDDGTHLRAPVVLLHGVGNNHHAWDFVLNRLRKLKLDVVAVDLLGFGKAPKPVDASYDLDDHADAVIAMLESKQAGASLVVGHSMGCLVAIHVAYKRPDLVHGLLLLGPPLYNEVPRQAGSSLFGLRVDGYFRIFDYIKNHPDTTKAVSDFADDFLPLVRGMEITDQTWQPFKRSLENTIMTTQGYDELIKLKVPTHCLYGLLDFFVLKRPIKQAAALNSALVSFKTVVGPHEITPLQSRKVARLIKRLSLLD
jgi:pimeloyl-ACP methyl ester carboxylesterase